MVLFGVMLVSVTAVLMGALSYTRARTALEVEARARVSLLAHDIAEHIRMELEDRAADITNWSHLEVMRALRYHDVDKELAEFVRQVLQGRGIYRAIHCTTMDGEPIAGAGEVDAVVWHPVPLRPRLAIVRPAPGGEAGSAAAGGLLQIETAVFDPQHPTTAIGGLFVLLDTRVLLESLHAAVAQAAGDTSVLLRETGGGVVVATRTIATDDRRRMLAGSAPVGPVLGLEGPRLEVHVSEPLASALAAATRLRRALTAIAALVLALGVATGTIVAWRISRPIRQLTDTVRQISERGQLPAEVDFPSAGGEIGVLATSFRTMMRSLAAAQNEALMQSRLAFLGEIAANIAHDVRTPLSVLKASAQLISRGELPIDEQRELAVRIAAEVDRLNRVVTSFVDLARPAPVHYATEQIADILARAAAFFGPMAAQGGIEIVRSVEDGAFRIHGSSEQLYQVFLNVIHNSVQAMRGPGTLLIRCMRDDGWVRIECEDTGPGFPPDVLPRVFAPFFTTKPQGTGLGLAMAKRIIEEHGGSIAAENHAPHGARVVIRLPSRDAA